MIWLMGGALLVEFLRAPILLTHGRVICEEANVYLEQAWTASAFTTLTALHQGYMCLLMNILALIAGRMVPLEQVGLVYTTGALCVMLLVVFLAVSCEEFRTPRTRLLAGLIILLTPAIDTFLTAETAQFVLPIGVAMVCLSSAQRHRIVRTGALLLGGLSAPASCCLSPFFLYRAYRQRTAMAWLQAGIITTCALYMAGVVLHSLSTGARHMSGPVKALWFGPVLFMKIFSIELGTRLAAFAAQRLVAGHRGLLSAALLWLLCAASVALFWTMARRAGTPGVLCFLMAFASLSFNYIGLGEPVEVVFVGAFRFFYTGFALFSLIMVLAYDRGIRLGDPRRLKFATALLALAFFTNFFDAAGYWTRLQSRDPKWSDEVAHWRRDPSYGLRVPWAWPEPTYLKPKK